MLQVKNITKEYRSGDLVQMALNDVSVSLRDNEFVAILGQSGSGKTTFLNVIGGLDHADSGELIIDSISTKKYKDRDWDSYRNHSVGFVFQSYYLIPHQSILKNVELALTISGVSKADRKKRAMEALEKVGLAEHIHKKPNQLSGGQMQRVAIARALVNNPSVLLADEPTGALDSETSVQIMELLKEVAKEKLVVMVTHNPELAEQYATRIIKLSDGKIVGDTNPFDVSEDSKEVTHKNMGKVKMSWLTSLQLSFNNLRSKKGRTILTAFAGSIGIIGIALILSISSGVNKYIDDIQKDTMSLYPITIQQNAFDLSSMFVVTTEEGEEVTAEHELDAVYSNSDSIRMASEAEENTVSENNLAAFKDYLDDENSEIHNYVGENGIAYTYNTVFDMFTYDPEGTFVNTDGSFIGYNEQTIEMGGTAYTMNYQTNPYISEMLPGTGDNLVSQSIMDSYDLRYGEWPSEYNDIILVVDQNNEIDLGSLYILGILPESEFVEILDNTTEMGTVDLDAVELNDYTLSYEDICGQSFYIMPEALQYVEDEQGYSYIGDDRDTLETMSGDMIEVHISGIVAAKPDAENASITTNIAYTTALTNEIISMTNECEMVVEQLANPDVNVLNGMTFSPATDADKVEDARAYIENMTESQKAEFLITMLQSSGMADEATMQALNDMTIAEQAAMCDQMLESATDEDFIAIYDSMISAGSYEENIAAFGVVDIDNPASISIYADSFADKDEIAACIEDYNNTKDESDQITYTDYVALIMSSVTTIVDVISYVLIAFVSVSLVVSSIMIGIITYISVLERTKEIGILRAIGASKRNISQVFNAETFIIGLLSGLIGVGITELLLIPINAIVHSLAGTTSVSGYLPPVSAVILIVLSVILTLIGGFIPSKKAARKDPVEALRTE